MLPRWVWHLCNLSCVYALFKLISIARYAFESPWITFEETKHEIYREHVAYLHSILWRRARLWLKLFANTVGRFLLRIASLSSYVFLRMVFSERRQTIERLSLTLRGLTVKRQTAKMKLLSSIYNITISWLYPLNSFRFIFSLPDSENDLLNYEGCCEVFGQAVFHHFSQRFITLYY